MKWTSKSINLCDRYSTRTRAQASTLPKINRYIPWLVRLLARGVLNCVRKCSLLRSFAVGELIRRVVLAGLSMSYLLCSHVYQGFLQHRVPLRGHPSRTQRITKCVIFFTCQWYRPLPVLSVRGRWVACKYNELVCKP